MMKAFLESAVVELVYKFDEKSTVFEKVSQLLKCHSNFMGDPIHIISESTVVLSM